MIKKGEECHDFFGNIFTTFFSELKYENQKVGLLIKFIITAIKAKTIRIKVILRHS